MEQPLSDEQWAQIKAALNGGRKIEAIKLYREATGVGLKEAKDAIDALDAEMRKNGASTPASVSSSPSKTGCVTLFVLGVGIFFSAILGFV